MRLIATVLIVMAVLATSASAVTPRLPPGVPGIRHGTSYESARLRLVEAGFRPVTFAARPATMCERGICRRAPEIYDCSSSAGFYSQCLFLYVRQRDARFLTVRSVTNDDFRFGFAYWTPRDELEWLLEKAYRTTRRSDRALLRAAKARMPEPPYVEPKIPLCSENGNRIPCWIKPPANFHR